MRSIHKSAWLLILFSAGLQILIFPLPGWYLVSWVAFAPLLIGLLRARQPETLQLEGAVKLLPARPGQAFLLAYLCGIAWYAGTCYWIYATMHHYGGLSRSVAVLVLILFCLYLAIYHAVFGLLLSVVAGRSVFGRSALIVTPFLWVAIELARTRITGFPWNLLGIAQVDNIPLARIAQFTGVYGVSFEIMLVNTAVAAAFLVHRGKRRLMLVTALGAAVALQAGRWITPPVLPSDRTALLIQENIPVLEASDWTRSYFEDTLRNLVQLSLRPSETSPSSHFDLIVWPESPAPFYTGDPQFREAMSQLAQQSQTWVVSGSIGVQSRMEAAHGTTREYNSAALVSPSGAWAGRYDKVHLVPFGEYVPFPKLFAFAGGLTAAVGDFGRGAARAPLAANGTGLGVFICYESIFPDEVRQFVVNGARVLVNISNDGWYGDSGAYAQHLNQTRMRAIENERWLLSATNTGVTASIDPYGRVVTRAQRKMRTALPASYALINRITFYTRHGDWFAYLCAIISAGALIVRFAFRSIREK